jgi:hypothetical protein
MTKTTHLELDLIEPNQSNKHIQANEAFERFSLIFADTLTLSITGLTSPYTLVSPDPALRFIKLKLTGSNATDPFIIHHPAKNHLFLIENTSTEAVTVMVSGETGITTDPEVTRMLYCNGTDVERVYLTGTGEAGPAGIEGPEGPAGPAGEAGETGPQGEAGLDGADGVGIPVGGTTGQALVKSSGTDYAVTWDDISTDPALGGDLSGTASAAVVTKIQGIAISTTDPANGEVLKFNGTAWAPGTDTSGGGGITDAASDGVSYVRKDAGWVAAYTGYDVPVFIPDKPTASMLCARIAAVRAFSLPSGLTGSVASAGVAATGSTTFDIQKNTSSVGSLNFAAAATTGTFTFASLTSWAAGDVLRIIAPATPDATLADISISFLGTRV